jgi:pimeloyl-ACP methyl ester carboxylesterase
MATIAEPTVERWFTPEFISGCPSVMDRVRSMLLERPPRSFAKATRAIAELSLWDDTGRIEVPVLVTTGEHDPTTNMATAEQIRLRSTASRLKVIPGCSHMQPLEQPKAYAQTIGHFLDSTSRTEAL